MRNYPLFDGTQTVHEDELPDDMLREAREWYKTHTRLVPAEFLDRSMRQPQYLYVGFLLELVRGLSERVRAAEQQSSEPDL